MSEYSIFKHSLHHVDREESRVEEDRLDKGKAEEYVHTIINKSLDAENVRRFKIKRESTETISLITAYIKRLIDEYNSDAAATIAEGEEFSIDIISSNIAKRLLEAEEKAQEKILKLKTEIRKGSLIQAIIIDEDDNFSYILAKVEHVNILDKLDWEQHTGLPLEKEILKTCVISFSSSAEIEEIKIFDTNKVISDYWSNKLLELEPLTTNEDNTQKSFNEINKVLVNNVKKVSRADYTLLHNSLLGYYNQNEGFDYNELIEKVFTNYKPQEEKVDIEKLKTKLHKIPENRFDRQFEIAPEAIRNKKKKTYSISDDIDLTIKDNIENLKDIIRTEKSNNDELFIKIKVSKEIFKDFNFNNI
ncbi:hypothetical protein CLHOM_24380 [Clostridium homopropionicum DSM 5847]|uniref:37-kD nucleoid-associated bacterial protein n=1 Tax=Clostridium homopropionicum DSM 5847 TaxID=1121318 RepID=A0A0L6Z8N4_9CLOT|nr:hypothetical protein [Clostridium homopropionicum]KOA19332.1 hypothetical protein CLHOM_24380 [Clostridium homopropionicum DSM 5847]SFG21462.1 hypothetical protein SAMN04488501_106198 [Clostridium homopropionicum]